MQDSKPQKPSIGGPGTAKRKSISVSQEGLIRAACLHPESMLPLMVQPSISGVKLVDWARNNREFIKTKLSSHGAILFRNFNLTAIAEFEQFIKAISGELLEYSYRSTPRTQVSGNIYTSTEYPASQTILLHNEMSYSLNWPMKIWFFCIEPAEQGGDTPIADSRKVFGCIAPKIKERFIQKKVMYVRNYGDGLDLAWQDVFQTSNRSEVEEYCRRTCIEFQWANGNRLRTRQLCQAVARHPETGEMVWFNQAHLFHVSSLKRDISESLLSAFKEDDLPRNVYYGDGSRIESSILDEIREVYRQEEVTFRWQAGDILMLDNMLVAHGRKPFLGKRKVVVGMADPFSDENINAE